MASLINKARKPKFELHLWIYDLNNVPLVAGTSFVKWHLPGSIHGEHRGRTPKCSIDKTNHRVTYNYSRTIPLRISIDKSNHLSECPIEFEVIQEFPMSSGSRDEKFSLGNVRLNLSEYVEESETFPRRSTASRTGSGFDQATRDNSTKALGLNHTTSTRKLNGTAGRPLSSGGLAPSPMSPPGTSNSTTANAASNAEENDIVDEEAEEGIVRRYLMQDSKVNSTLKMGILMVQIDGERSYIAPPLRSATMFNTGISGIVMSNNEPGIADDGKQFAGGGDDPCSLPSSLVNKSRDTAEAQDMYRRALAASWDCQADELPADECIEDIFAGGSGWIDDTTTIITRKKPAQRLSPHSHHRHHHYQHHGIGRSGSSSSSSMMSASSGSDDLGGDGGGSMNGPGTLKPQGFRRMNLLRSHRSNLSEVSDVTVTGNHQQHHYHQQGERSPRRDSHGHHQHSRSGSRGAGDARHSLLTIRKEDSGLSISSAEDQGFSNSSQQSLTGGPRSRSESLTSLVPTLGSVGSDRGGGVGGRSTSTPRNASRGGGGRHGGGDGGSSSGEGRGGSGNGRGSGRRAWNKPPREIDEYEIRDDLVAWKLPGTVV